jgi:hypothetical protein
MPSHARVWIYQSNRPFTESEAEIIKRRSASFADSWTAHKKELKASAELIYNRFLILAVDEKEAAASGCSIDSSVHFVKSLEAGLNVSFFDRLSFAFKKNDHVEALSKDEFEKAISEGIITQDTIVFNNLVQTKKELDERWEIPLKDSWHKQLME